jgi:hypothetical protein
MKIVQLFKITSISFYIFLKSVTSISFYIFLKSVQTGDYHGGCAVNNSLTYALVTVTPPPPTCKPEKELFLW